jgi:DNA-binding MarR family transcriptional regulator
MPHNAPLLSKLALKQEPATIAHTGWRETHLGRILGNALRRFDARVLTLMASDTAVPLALANLARRDQICAAHIHITRHLPQTGARLSALALSAGMSKQAMGKLAEQCMAWGLVERSVDPLDARAVQLRFTPVGLAWMGAFERATTQAQAEFRQEVGPEVATVVELGLEAYGDQLDIWPAGKRRRKA